MKRFCVLGVKVTVILGLLWLTGCAATFRGNELARIDQLRIESPDEQKPSAYFEVTWLTGLRPTPKQNVHYMPSFVEAVQRIAKESHLFGEVTIAKSKVAKDYTIRVSMLNHGNRLVATCLGAISGATLTIIPAYARDNYRLEAIVYDSSGRELKRYQYDDHTNGWIWLPLLPVAPFTEKVDDKVRENMLRHFFKDLAEDRIVKRK